MLNCEEEHICIFYSTYITGDHIIINTEIFVQLGPLKAKLNRIYQNYFHIILEIFF
jgi:hypothetical protein